jgi:hypothetical protein
MRPYSREQLLGIIRENLEVSEQRSADSLWLQGVNKEQATASLD